MNPELRRNLWLEITTHRLLAMPLVLGMLFLLLAAVDKPNAIEHVSLLALGGYGLLAVLWGSRLAANSIIDEMADKTWDWQRLSTLGPWTMTWGKLFGATAFAWYGGLICLAVFLATASATKIVAPFKFGVSLVLLAVMLHAASIAAALHISRSGAPANRRSIGVLLVFLLLYLVPITLAKAWGSTQAVVWYANNYNALDFLCASSAVFAAWAVAGAYRAMCQSLAVRTLPGVWLAFLLFVSVYFAGFAVTDAGHRAPVTPLQAIPVAGLICGVLFTYVMLFTEATGPVVVRRIAQKVRLEQWTRALQELPCWPVTLLFAAVSALVIAAQGMNVPDGASPAWREWTTSPISAVLLVARDAGILLFFAAAAQPKRVVGTTIVYMLLLYWIVPGLLTAMGLTTIAALVFPFGPGNPWVQCISALVQASIAGWLACRRIQVNFSTYRRADGA